MYKARNLNLNLTYLNIFSRSSFTLPFDARLSIANIPANKARSIPTRLANRNTDESVSIMR